MQGQDQEEFGIKAKTGSRWGEGKGSACGGRGFAGAEAEEEERQAAEEGTVNPSLLRLTLGIWVRGNASRQTEQPMQKIGARRPRAQLQDQQRTEPVPRREGDPRRLGGAR